MKLDIDCVRDVLLEFEELPFGCHTPCDFPNSISKYGDNTVEYTLSKLQEGGFITANISKMQDGSPNFLGIYDITFSGHQFLETIRNNKVWGKTKNVAGKVGCNAFSIITQIASSVISELITKQIRV